MKKKNTSNPHCLPAAAFKNRNQKKLPPLNLFIRERIERLAISPEEIAELLGLSRSKSYLVMCGYFISDYEARIALSKLLRVPLKTLILWEYGLLEESDQPKPEDGIEELKKQIFNQLQSLQEAEGLSIEEVRRLI